MNPGMAGDDAALDQHVAAIAAKLRGGAAEERPDTRENREDRDATDVTPTDLEELERIEREGQATEEQGESRAEAETEGAEKAEDEADAFIELPPAEEGAEPERIPVNEALEAVKQLRQMNGEIATAVIKAEEEAFAKQDHVTQQMHQTFRNIEAQGLATLEMMRLYAPQVPHPDDFHTTEDFYKAKLYYEDYHSHYHAVEAKVKASQRGQSLITTQQDSDFVRRETERASRFIPEFKAPETRKARMAEIADTMGKHFGVTQAEIDEIVDHKAWRIMDKLDRTLRAEKKAPEVKKHLQETKPRIVNGRAPQTRDPRSGQFVNQARKELKETGSEDAFARMLMRSGAIKDLMKG